MSEAKIISTGPHPLFRIVLGDRLRPVSDAGVSAIVESVRELGVMKDPIHVRKKKSGQLVLMAGAHRLTAAIQMEWTDIPATIWECTDAWARLMEIDDNLASAELTALDTAVFLAERKRVYLTLHPETKAGVAGGLARQGLASDMMSFAECTAEKFGLSKRHVERLVKAGDTLNAEMARQLRLAPKPVTLADLQTLGKIGDADERAHVVLALAHGTERNAARARQAFRADRDGTPPPMRRADQEYMTLRTGWDRASKEARRMFLEERWDDVIAMQKEMGL